MELRAIQKIAHEMKLGHRSCNHSQGQFVAKSWVNHKSFKAHTGGVDSAWRLLSKIHTYIRAWQWRWENTCVPNLCKQRQWHTCARKRHLRKVGRQNGNTKCTETEVLNKNQEKNTQFSSPPTICWLHKVLRLPLKILPIVNSMILELDGLPNKHKVL